MDNLDKKIRFYNIFYRAWAIFCFVLAVFFLFAPFFPMYNLFLFLVSSLSMFLSGLVLLQMKFKRVK